MNEYYRLLGEIQDAQDVIGLAFQFCNGEISWEEYEGELAKLKDIDPV